jgi:osmotically-inducible protein OsmY
MRDRIPMSRTARRTSWTLAIILAGVLPGCAVYQKCGLAGCPGDRELTADVWSAYAPYPELRPPNVLHVQTLDRVVYLSGEVNTNFERLTAEEVARRVPGVARVVNSINLSYSSDR